jgi:hypothetical protein
VTENYKKSDKRDDFWGKIKVYLVFRNHIADEKGPR